eukprot:TRINITY_DN6376_c0_g1_i3.p1 TRINITY_DN6376_c0_g1~~TRINITY_DN6376_c0_g1_i3.p1  ORF type:complete len:284 (+),score=55.61 TRINITY_DN6376_c0_g1_i3:95-946(+)
MGSTIRLREMHSMNGKYKTMLCRYYERDGTCIKGDQCQYAHGDYELRRREAYSYENFDYQSGGGGGGGLMKKSNKYTPFPQPTYSIQQKPQLCAFYLKGECRFGDKCKYLHEEVKMEEKEKTTPQKTFQTQNKDFEPDDFGPAMDGYNPEVEKKNEQELDAATQHFISKMQLRAVLEGIEHHLPNLPEDFKSKLLLSKEKMEAGELGEAGLILNQILMNPLASADEKEKFKEILFNAAIVGNCYLSQLTSPQILDALQNGGDPNSFDNQSNSNSIYSLSLIHI